MLLLIVLLSLNCIIADKVSLPALKIALCAFNRNRLINNDDDEEGVEVLLSMINSLSK